MPGLKKIILIDTSICQGSYLDIDISSHLFLSGRNGVGKTTILELAFLAFGLPYVKLDKGKSFLEWNLPRESSSIVFEYENHDGETCLAFMTRNTTGAAWRFAKTGFNFDIFMNGDVIANHAQAVANLVRRGVQVSDKIESTPQFKAVMLGTGTKADNHKIRMLENMRFGMFKKVRGNRGLDDLAGILFAMFQKAGAYKNLKSAIMSSVMGGGDEHKSNIFDRLDLNKSAEIFRNAMSDAAAVEIVTKLGPNFDEASEILSRIEAREAYLGGLLATILRELPLKKDAIKDVSEKMREASVIYKADISNLNAERRAWAAKLGEADQDVHGISGSLSSVRKRASVYESMDISSLRVIASGLETLQVRLFGVEEERAAIADKAVSIDRLYDRRIEEAKRAEFIKKAAIREAAKVSEANLSEMLERILDDRATESSKAANLFRKKRSELQDRFDQATILVGSTKSAGFVMPDELKKSLDDARAERNKRELSVNVARNASDQAKAAYAAAKSDHAKAEARLSDRENAVAVSETRLVTAKGAMTPPSGTVLAQLREGMPGWQETVGRVVSKEFLSSTIPVSFEDDDGAVFGMRFDAASLPACRFPEADDDGLQQAVEKAEKGLENDISESVVARKGLSGASKIRSEAEREMQTKLIMLTAAEAAHKKAKEVESDVLKDISDAEKGTRERAMVVAASAEADRKRIKALISENDTQESSAISEIERRASEARRKVESERAEISIGIIRSDKEITDQIEAEVSSMMAARLQAMSEEGVDAGRLREVEETAEKTRTEITLSKKAKESVENYDEDFPKIKNEESFLESKLEEASKMSSEASLKISEISEMIATTESMKTKVETESRGVILKMTDEIEGMEILISQMDDIFPTEASDELVLETAVVSARDQIRSRGSDRAKISAVTSKIVSSLQKAGHESLDNLVERVRQDYGDYGEKAAQTLTEWRNDLFRTVLLDTYRARMDIVKNVVTSYLDEVDSVTTGISSFQRKINEKLSQQKNFRYMSGVRVEIGSVLRKSEIVAAAKSFQVEIEDWNVRTNSESTPLPDEKIMGAFRELSDAMRKSSGTPDLANMLTLQGEFTEDGELKRFESDADIEKISSTGITQIFLVSLYAGFIDIIRGDQQVVLPFSVDEFNTLDEQNKNRLIEFVEEKGMRMFIACPQQASDSGSAGASYILEKAGRTVSISVVGGGL